MILVIDNYDSFTFNLVQYIASLHSDTVVKRNDEITVDEVAAMHPDAIVVSPGPGRPQEAGISMEAILKFYQQLPILGVCLGHQSIGAAFGAKIIHAREIMHGRTSEIECDGKGIFAGLTTPVQVMRYHSLAVEEASLPDCFEVSARTADGEIMGMRHRQHPLEGVQFHPESIMSPQGMKMIENFIAMM